MSQHPHRDKTTARSYHGADYAGDFNLSLLDAEIDPAGAITETEIDIDPEAVPAWLRAMWAEAKTEA